MNQRAQGEYWEQTEGCSQSEKRERTFLKFWKSSPSLHFDLKTREPVLCRPWALCTFTLSKGIHTHTNTHTQSHTQSPVAFQTRHQPSSTFIAIVCVSSVAFAHLATKHFRTLTQHADGLYLMRRFRWEVLFGQMNAKVTVLHIVGVAGLTMFSHQTLSLITAEEV